MNQSDPGQRSFIVAFLSGIVYTASITIRRAGYLYLVLSDGAGVWYIKADIYHLYPVDIVWRSIIADMFQLLSVGHETES